MILVIDNYDSFTYNLVQEIGEMYSDILVKRNDEITLDEIAALHPQALIISPGPGYPDRRRAGERLRAGRRAGAPSGRAASGWGRPGRCRRCGNRADSRKPGVLPSVPFLAE